MEAGLRSISKRESDRINWIEAVLYLSDKKYVDFNRIRLLSDCFYRLTVAGPGPAPKKLPDDVRWYSIGEKSIRSQTWDTLIAEAELPWLFFIEDDEQVHIGSLPGKRQVEDRQWAPALIKHEENGSDYQYYQMRLVNTEISKQDEIFEGQNLPDATRFVRQHELKILNHPVVIERESNPVIHVDIDQELSVKDHAPKLYLVQGKRYFKDKKYVRAAAQYRQLLKKEKLLPFDRLAGVNGLASCLTEQHKWEKALSLTKRSLEAESLQSLPYLIQFRIYELRKQWQKAYDALKQYYGGISLFSRANFDRSIEEEKTLVNLANVSLKAGYRSDAAKYFDKLFAFKRRDADPELLQKALLLSIDLGNFKRSVYFFNRLFGEQFPPHKMDRGIRKKLDDILDMFVKRGWYEFVSDIYNKLHNAYPEDQTYKRKLIAALSKTNQLDRAKSMVANIV